MVVDWNAIGFAGPPISGEPGTVTSLAQDLATVAEVIDEQITRLDGIDADAIWDSQASLAFKEARADLPDLLGQISSRYRQAGGVIETYAGTLAGTVVDMDYWGARAVEAKATLDAAELSLAAQRQHEQDVRDQVDWWNQENPDRPSTAPPSRLGQYEGAVDEARSELDLALGRIRDAVAAKDEAGARAAVALAEVNDDSLENSSNPFTRFARWVSDTLDLPAWADVLRFVASVVSIAALMLCWVPILGPILGATALVLNVVLLAVDATLAISGEGSWGEVAWSAFGVMTGGLGRAFSAAARTAQQGYRLANGVRMGRGVRMFFDRGGSGLVRSGGAGANAYAPSTSVARAFWSHAQPWANFPEVLDHVRVVRNGRNLPLSLGGHNPGYWNAFRANAATHGRNLVGLGGPGAVALVWGDAFRRVGLPTLSGNPPNPVARWDDLQARAADAPGAQTGARR